MKNNQIILKNYEEILGEIRNQINLTQKNISQIVTRQKVVMAWQIGKLLENHLRKNNQKGYGDHLIEQLEKDVGISQSVLYKMRNFYKSYPKLPADDSKLNWSHYRVLSGVKEESERKYLEDLTKEKSLDSRALQSEVNQSKISQIRATSKANQALKKVTALKAKRGQLFLYNLIKPVGAEKICIDCGFGIFRAIAEEQLQGLKKGGQIVETVKKNKKYSLKKSAATSHKLNAYKAYVKRVVDGDTLHVILDLGFEIFHEEILRLRGINAPERDTAAGQKSSNALKNILKKSPFLILKSTANDVYGRYVADVFLAEKETKLSEQEVADKGVFLNQLLLDRGLVELF